MDFNPLDLLAAAALSDKGSPSNGSESSSKDNSVSDQDNNSDSAESKDAKDGNLEKMGKAKGSSVNQPVKISSLQVKCEMSPQKTPWSPDSFLACLDRPSIDHDSLLIEEFSPTFIKEKINFINMCNDNEKKVTVFENGNFDFEKSEKNISLCDDLNLLKKDDLCQDKPQLIEDVAKENSHDSVQSHGFDVANKLSCDDKCEVENSDVKLDVHESCSQSDTDTAETSDEKAVADELPEIILQELVALDHSYCLLPGQVASPNDPFDEDVDVCSDGSPLTEDSEQRSRNLSLDCNYLKSGILEGKSASTPQLHQYLSKPSLHNAFESPSKIPINPNSSAFKQVGVLSPERPASNYGKFKIGTFASFSSGNLELEKYLRGLDSHVEKGVEHAPHDDLSTKGSHSPQFSSVQPLLQSPTPDWDRSEAGSETQDDSSDARTPHRLSPELTVEKATEWSHPMYHDHDYCAKSQQTPVADDTKKVPHAKRKYTKRKNRLDSVSREKIMKAKYLKKELLKDSLLQSRPNTPTEVSTTTDEFESKTNPVGRPRKRPLEKPPEEEIDPETGAKMKITGKFQDQYVYYLSKSKTTSRRRQTLPQLLTDKIIVPAPKPGDIVVPHLTDADIEVVRAKGRGALNLPERPLMPNMSSVASKLSVHPHLPGSQSTSEMISDVDSHIVSTILSMENDNLASPSSSQSHDFSENSELYHDQSPIADGDQNMTNEQVLNYLWSVVKEEEPSLLQSSGSLFPPVSSECLYSKSEHLSDPNIESHSPVANMSHAPLVSHSFDNSVKSDVGSFPDDLSSFISPSQITSSNTTQEGDSQSQSSIRSDFSSDFSPLGTPNLPAPRLTSIEKTLDYLGVKDGEIKLEQSDLFSCKNSIEVPPELDSFTDTIPSDDTPWIVTVTLFFNDVPAIMMINEPYIRLVDIHKQILPAKDTGILKKRCQLLNIPVLNCSEMHRYFLVQYGKAYNSKSTLIISKDQATSLVGYYANPQPRMGRADEVGIKRQGSRDGSGSPVAMDTAVRSGTVKKRGSNRNFKKGLVSGLATPDVEAASSTATGQENNSGTEGLNKRTRHKKVNYLEMLKGEEKERTHDNGQETEQSLHVTTDHSLEVSKVSKDKSTATTKSNSKKKRGAQCNDKKVKEHSNPKKKTADSKKKVKDNTKRLATSKAKRSNSKSVKNHEKSGLVKREIECTSASAVDLGSADLSNKSRCKSLKLKVNSLLNFSPQRKSPASASSLSPSKKGLFSRSNSSPAAEECPVRVLAVAHQAATSIREGESHLPSQPADIHLDLFTKSSSACVRCHTCSQFLSVPHFMRHHHVPMDNEWLATEAAHRILVPRNKENISDEERRLWEEFHRLQEAIGGFGEGDDDDDSDSDEGVDEESDFEENDGQSSLESSGASFLSMDTSRDHPELSYDKSLPQSSELNSAANTQSSSLRHSQNTPVTAHQNSSSFRSNSNLLPSDPTPSVHTPQECMSNIRTSSRRRKSKQLFSIENYCTPSRRSTDDEINSALISDPGEG